MLIFFYFLFICVVTYSTNLLKSHTLKKCKNCKYKRKKCEKAQSSISTTCVFL